MRCAMDVTPGGRSKGARSTCRPSIDEGARAPAITADELCSIFGRRRQRGVEAVQHGKTRDELRDGGLTAAVIDASFSVDPGEIFVVMGLSGSGKSTLIRMVNGLLPATAGELVIGDDTLSSMNSAQLRAVSRKRISMV